MLLMALGLVSAVVLTAAGCSGAGKSAQSTGQGGSSQASGSGGKSQAQRATTGESRAASVEELGHPVLGDKNAPVTMIEYGDYQ